MVTKSEETQLNRLEAQVENGGVGAWEYLCLVRKLKVRRFDKVLKHGLSILNSPKKQSSLSPEGRLEGMLLNAKGSWAEAEKRILLRGVDLISAYSSTISFSLCPLYVHYNIDYKGAKQGRQG